MPVATPNTKTTPLEVSVLNWVNQQRESRGLEPLDELPYGHPTNSGHCPVARGLGFNAVVSVDDYELYSEDSVCESGIIPDYVSTFIQDFDEGEYPHLIEEETE